MIIHLNGWPGVGKMTIGRLLAKRLGARLVHNHVLHDVAFACAGHGDADRWPLYEKVRKAAYDVLETRPKSEVFVMTNALCVGDKREEEAWHHVVNLAVTRGVPLVPVVLTAHIDILKSRITSKDRLSSKIANVEELSFMVSKYKLQVPDVEECLEVDVSELSPEDASLNIQALIQNISGQLLPATVKHYIYT